MGRAEDDIVFLLGLGIVGAIAYNEWYRGKPVEDILNDIDTKLRTFLDSVASQLPTLPPIPTPPPLPPFQFPFSQPQQSPITTPTSPAAPSTNTANDTGEEPKVHEPPVKPEGSGQLPTNPAVPPPPTGSGGAIIAFAGDFDSNSKALQTVQSIDKQNCQLIVGTGDYSYSGEKASAWFNKIIGSKWSGKMKGCLGNHDTHDKSGFLSVFGQSAWNSVAKVAPNLAVVFIDTESGVDAGTLDTLTTQAKGTGAKFIAYVFHKPYITSANAHHGPGENKWRTTIEAAAKKHGVKLMLCGHNHLYEHFMCGGTHYITSGAAGRKFYAGNCQGSCGPVKCVEDTNGFLKVSVGNTLLCQFISNSGQELDTFNIQ